MRIMGLDVGERTIGVAVSDELGLTAQGVAVIRRTSKEADVAALQRLIEQYGVTAIVVGLPRNMNGTLGPTGERCQAFARFLEKRLTLPVHLWDERLTTVLAERTLLEADLSRRRRKQVVDKVAAAVMLQGYLDAKRREWHGDAGAD
ncbi:Holliday junction resolvase RuvX [Calditerricola satsumensis]|uniref:Putative pre-16S rRNA nuclease n=1 Tax=Calditerricola satsumensis TaxID=373054 RepID=A0A8J3B9R9_9BACI|nr:Holliday junction resolvase RuvX [Calditerricola satsumensis]GGK05764.1 putative pre-16S rRNA nuclease [Calditerricola satsumensis]